MSQYRDALDAAKRENRKRSKAGQKRFEPKQKEREFAVAVAEKVSATPALDAVRSKTGKLAVTVKAVSA